MRQFQFSNHMGVIAVRPKIPINISAAVIATVLSAFMLTAPARAADSVDADALTRDCANVETVFARGSGQLLLQGEVRRFNDQIAARIMSPLTTNHYELGTQLIDGHQYAAVPVGIGTWQDRLNSVGAGLSGGSALWYGTSVDNGVEEMASYLNDRSAKCPSSYFVVGGFSQGAQVAGETYSEKLSDGLRNRVVYQALFGAPPSLAS